MESSDGEAEEGGSSLPKISFEGKVGIGLALVGLFGAGVVIVRPELQPLGWAMIALAVVAGAALTAHHGRALWLKRKPGGRAPKSLIAFSVVSILGFVSVFSFLAYLVFTGLPDRPDLIVFISENARVIASGIPFRRTSDMERDLDRATARAVSASADLTTMVVSKPEAHVNIVVRNNGGADIKGALLSVVSNQDISPETSSIGSFSHNEVVGNDLRLRRYSPEGVEHFFTLRIVPKEGVSSACFLVIIESDNFKPYSAVGCIRVVYNPAILPGTAAIPPVTSATTTTGSGPLPPRTSGPSYDNVLSSSCRASTYPDRIFADRSDHRYQALYAAKRVILFDSGRRDEPGTRIEWHDVWKQRAIACTFTNHGTTLLMNVRVHLRGAIYESVVRPVNMSTEGKKLADLSGKYIIIPSLPVGDDYTFYLAPDPRYWLKVDTLRTADMTPAGSRAEVRDAMLSSDNQSVDVNKPG